MQDLTGAERRICDTTLLVRGRAFRRRDATLVMQGYKALALGRFLKRGGGIGDRAACLGRLEMNVNSCTT